MKKDFITRAFVGFVVVLGLSAFVPSPTSTDYITSTAWKLVVSTIYPALDTNGGSTTDMLDLQDTCFTDDYIVFTTDSLLKIYDDTIKCDTMYTDPYPTIWYFDSTETNIIFENIYFSIGSRYSVNLLKLDGDTLMFEYDDIFNQDTFTVTNTYIHPD